MACIWVRLSTVTGVELDKETVKYSVVVAVLLGRVSRAFKGGSLSLVAQVDQF